jgi:RNA polymerase sigma-70 factor (ECF subfamily)
MDHDVFLHAIQSHDADAFARWMSAAEAPIRGSLTSFAAVIDVEAVLQEALLRVWQVPHRFEPDGRPNGLVRFAIRIARNLAITEVRRVRATPVAEIEGPAIEPATPDPLLRAAIAACRDKLPDRPRRAIDARIAGDPQSDDDVARSLGMSRNTFLQNITRARRALADCLRRAGVVLDPGAGL